MRKLVIGLGLMARQLEYLRAQAAQKKYYEVEASLLAAILAVERRLTLARKRRISHVA
jgi:hypothetical protein